LEALECAKPLNLSISHDVHVDCVTNGEAYNWSKPNMAITKLRLEVDTRWSTQLDCGEQG
jgi:hypothetical protein